MLVRVIMLIRGLLVVSVSDKFQNEFKNEMNKLNVIRVKSTAVTFIILELIMMTAYLLQQEGNLFEKPNFYYWIMYVIMIAAMILYLLVFVKFGKNIPKHGTGIMITGISFTCFILFWCAGISLLDQIEYGQIIVYVVAIIAVAAVPLFHPITLLFIYLAAQLCFIGFMPLFQQSYEVLFGNFVNSTLFMMIAWVISRMRYKYWTEDFYNKKLIQEKNEELMGLNKELEEANRKLEILSKTDSLTGLFNRSVFDHTIRSEWNRCKRHAIPLSLIMIDIDFFKSFNDYYGHQAGDECLRQVSGIFRSCVRRSSDIVSRYGGEEFAIILPHMKEENAYKLAEEIRTKVEKLAIPHEQSSVSHYLTISLGVSTLIPSETSSIKRFIDMVDKALYVAKKNRNQTVTGNETS